MRHMKEMHVPAETKVVLDYVSCDLCGERIKEPGSYEVDEVNTSHRVGTSYPEGGSGATTTFDLCARCFTEKLVPWAAELGAYPRVTDWDY